MKWHQYLKIYPFIAFVPLTPFVYNLLSVKFVKFQKDVRCDNKIVLITGGNSGIGKETANELAKRGAVVYLLCRDEEKCDAARKEIIECTKNEKVYSRKCDLASLDSVKKFSDEFHKGDIAEKSHVNILINNAGVYSLISQKTQDEFELNLGVNYLGHFYLTNLLLDLLKNGAPSRIINITAPSYVRGKINKENLNSTGGYESFSAYNQSKLANILFTLELAERLKNTGVTVNAVSPGVSNTSFYWKNSSFSFFLGLFCKPVFGFFTQTPVEGAQTSLYAALDPDLKTVTGKYFSNCKEEEIKPELKDAYTIKWLWAVSEKWTRLRSPSNDTKLHDNTKITS